MSFINCQSFQFVYTHCHTGVPGQGCFPKKAVTTQYESDKVIYVLVSISDQTLFEEPACAIDLYSS